MVDCRCDPACQADYNGPLSVHLFDPGGGVGPGNAPLVLVQAVPRARVPHAQAAPGVPGHQHLVLVLHLTPV